MRELEKRLGIAFLVLAIGACSDAGPSPQGDDEDPTFEDEDTSQEESPAFVGDGGPIRDSGIRADTSVAPPSDAGEEIQPMPDGGRRRRDASVPGDATTPPVVDAGPLPVSDAAIPEGDYCAATASWNPAWAAFEDEVLTLTNEARAVGHNCDAEGNFGPTTPLAMEPRLRCAARLYSKLMADTGTFAHDGPDGSKVDTRIKAAGYTKWSTWGENIAKGQQTPAEVVSGWLDSDGHCSNIMSPNFTQIGVGFYPLPSTNPKGRQTTLWTQDFAKPR